MMTGVKNLQSDSRSARIETALRVYVANQAEPLYTKDISSSGFFLSAPDRWTQGEVADFILEDGDLRLAVRGRAMRLTQQGAGFAFIDRSPELKTALPQIISRCFAAGASLVDRRRRSRWPFDLPVVWRVAGAGEFRARLFSLSPDGAGLRTEVKPPTGSIIYLLLPIPGPEIYPDQSDGVMGARARVAYLAAEDRLGTEFLEPSQEFLENITRLLATARSPAALRRGHRPPHNQT